MKRINVYEIFGLVILLSLTIIAGVSCGAKSGRELAGVTWVLQSYGNPPNLTQAVTDRQTYLTFDAKKMTIAGNGGVNGFGGDYKLNGGKISFSGMIHTMMAMEGPIMGQENAFFKIMGSAQTYQVKDKLLTISGTEGVLIFTQK